MSDVSRYQWEKCGFAVSKERKEEAKQKFIEYNTKKQETKRNMEFEVEAQVDNIKEQSQGLFARLAWVLMLLCTPFGSPIIFCYLLVYQFCLVGAENLSVQAKGVTAVAAIFFAIAWVPVVSVILYCVGHDHDQNDFVNAFAPLGALSIFCLWGSVVAFRHFSIRDSYEPETERSAVKRLKDIAIEPPLVVRGADVPVELREQLVNDARSSHGGGSGAFAPPGSPANQTSQFFMPPSGSMFGYGKYNASSSNPQSKTHQQQSSTFPGADASSLFPTDSQLPSRHGQVLLHATDALQLYQVLKGPVEHTVRATLISVVLSATTVSIVRTEGIRVQSASGEYSEVLYALSTFFFSGMFLVFYSTFALVITIYLHQVSFIRRLTYAVDDNVAGRLRPVRIETMHLKQLRAWEACRRLAVEELTSPKSILNAIFTPSMWLSAVGTVSIFSYLVARLLFQRQDYGQVSISLTILMVVLVGFMMCSIGVAKIAQKHFKRHSALIAQKTFDVARRIDVYLTNADQGIDDPSMMFQAELGNSSRGIDATTATAAGSGGVVGGAGSSAAATQGNNLSLNMMEQVYASLHSLCTFIIANQPRPLILGIELRHVRFVVVFVMLISGNVLFVSLMVAFKSGDCGT